MAHRLRIEPIEVVIEGRAWNHLQARCSCGWSGPVQVFAGEAFGDARIHAALHDAPLPEIPAP